MKRRPKLIIMFLGIILGIFISSQMSMNLDMYIPATVASIQNAQNDIKIINKEIDEFSKIIKEKEKELDTLKKISESGELLTHLEEDIERNRQISGITNLEGPGIKISMYDNQEIRNPDHNFDFDLNDDIIHDIDILIIINDLKNAGAEAISINDERLIAGSDIKCGGPIIRINGRSSGTPFVIKAIGDPKLLNAAVNAPNSYGDILKNVYKKGFDTSTEDSVVIPGYDMVINYRYAKPIGEEK